MKKYILYVILSYFLPLSLSGCAFTRQFAVSDQSSDKYIFIPPVTLHICATCYHRYPHDLIHRTIDDIELMIVEFERYMWWLTLIPIPKWSCGVRCEEDGLAKLKIYVKNNSTKPINVRPYQIKFMRRNGESIEHSIEMDEKASNDVIVVAPDETLSIKLLGGENYSFARNYILNVDSCFDEPNLKYGNINVHHRTITTLGLIGLD